LWRRRAIAGVRVPEELHLWLSKGHELDFVLSLGEFLKVKHGCTSPVEFAWFSKVFPKAHLTVISQTRYDTANLTGIGPQGRCRLLWQWRSRRARSLD
jgi:hypothetical protein